MNTFNINHILNREEQEKYIENILKDFEENKKDLNIKRSIYVYGNSGTGKTQGTGPNSLLGESVHFGHIFGGCWLTVCASLTHHIDPQCRVR